ncbi:helix-turn-helix domain-containing protein [Flavobacterium sp. TP390]|uniref:Helix-turn-helix domain-containing protein n=1 Tax=Flavobacterium profundi TaxID=1774945 RepID=A0A6I4ILV2_9FLAO|nr:helix-turn-helix domain-containing protein [Flavobacterium profundi]MVO09779.1 helix-turn-helix domain-containing protein [Flavobacterium profundi]
MKNYISNNLSFLVNKMNCSRDEFGAMFGLNRGNISFYINEKSQPKIETIQSICDYFKISIDDFINNDLSNKNTSLNTSKTTNTVDSEIITKEIQLRDDLIVAYKDKIELLTKQNEEILVRLENKVDLATSKIDESAILNQNIFKELEEQLEYINLKENLEKAKKMVSNPTKKS